MIHQRLAYTPGFGLPDLGQVYTSTMQSAVTQRKDRKTEPCTSIQTNNNKKKNIDHAGPFQGKLFLAAVDAFSKWTEAKIVQSTSIETIIKVLREMFATNVLPNVIVSDNGTSFTSDQFQTFLKTVERAIQTLKNILRKIDKGDWSTRLARSLMTMRITVLQHNS
ncbi:K02A2.6-like [Cordylochernes scorpioides]|uniref:K02A2.6-like n=1 Tax=Cordylochernes scorpioides TaxID=51811 RepID=A0ABY6KD22_9ARAC|nr:K02A2.6-like [Cordylochernes scorpioides]